MSNPRQRGPRRRRIAKTERESRELEFKEQFDPEESGGWCELIKDIVAIANSGGGRIIVGIKDDGQPSGWDPSPLLLLDHAKVVDRISRYVGEPFSEFEIDSDEWKRKHVAVIAVAGVSVPMIFVQPGTYDLGNGKQKTAFGRGTIYFRHGAKSETAHPRDLRMMIQRELERVRKSWMGNIRKVVNAPAGTEVRVVQADVHESSRLTSAAIRLVDDPKASAYRKLDPDTTHPYRQTELVKRVNELLGGSRKASTYDILCVRRVHATEKRPDWYYKPKFGSPQYSEGFADWIAKQQSADPGFFDKCRETIRSSSYTSRRG